MYKIFTRKICTPLGYILNFLLFAVATIGHIDQAEKRKWLMRIKFTSLICFITLLQVSAAGLAQRLTYKQQNVTLKQLFGEINKQTGYNVFWSPKLIRGSERINADFTNTALTEVLEKSLDGLPVTFVIEDKSVVIKEKDRSMLGGIFSFLLSLDVRGRVVDEEGRPKEGVTVKIKGLNRTVYTNKLGDFTLNQVDEKAILLISYIGYATKEIKASADLGTIKLELSNSKLDEVQVIAYGTSSQRLNTGAVAKVGGDELVKSPVSNPLLAMEGRVPGLIINQTSGVPGSAVKIQIRGRTRIDQSFGADETPLFIIDGVPMASGNSNLNLLQSAITSSGTSGLSPFSTINAGDIESIEVLKDADATAIYGSRGASGVILITTKKGQAGKTRINLKMTSGFSKAPLPDLLSTSEYVAMRKEAFKNDNIAMTKTNAYDILSWDTTRNENLAKQLIGGRAAFTNAEGSISGGSELVNFSLSGAYNRQTDVYPKPQPNTRANVHMSVGAQSANKKFSADFTGNYSSSINKSTSSDLSGKVTLPPNYLLYNQDGSIAWNEGGVETENPLAYTLRKYQAKTSNLNANILLGYKFTPDLSFKTSVGYNEMRTDEISISPKAAVNPNKSDNGTSSFGNNNFQSWIIEPQLNYNKKIGKSKLNVLLGGTFQTQHNNGYNFTVRDYTSDDFLGTLIGVTSASFINPSSNETEYKYAAAFGRVTYNYDDTYLLNISGRRDGSSRFGPNYRYSSFGAVGAGWIFSNESFFENDWLSFGKLRASYGTTGNDKIGDYKYIDLYGSNVFGPTYTDSLALSPTSLFKPDLHWEKSKKLEVALELGFLKDRILVTTAWYRNRSNDPLVQYPLPSATGFQNVVANLNDVVVQNQGLELTVNSKNIHTKDFDWLSTFNLTLPQNKLLAYPGLDQSSYANKYILGRSLDVVYIGHYLGVDPEKGLYQVEDVNKNGVFDITNTGDLLPRFDTEPALYGGIQNDFRYKNFSLSVFMNFNKQYVRNWRTVLGIVPVGSSFSTNPVGGIGNVPSYVLNRWQYPGQVTDVQKFTTVIQPSNSLYGQGALASSDATYSNVFYMRLRTVELNYNVPVNFAKKIGLSAASIFVQAQNLFTFAPFGTDPETMFLTRLGPLRTFVAGIQVNF